MNIPKHLLIKFDELKVGQRVWSARFGYTDIINIRPPEKYPIKTPFACYSADGREFLYDKLPTLFLDCPYQEEERVVEVSDDGQFWRKRVLIGKFRGLFICWEYVESVDLVDPINHGTTQWKFMREIQPVKEVVLTREQIAEKFGCRVEELKIVE